MLFNKKTVIYSLQVFIAFNGNENNDFNTIIGNIKSEVQADKIEM